MMFLELIELSSVYGVDYLLIDLRFLIFKINRSLLDCLWTDYYLADES